MTATSPARSATPAAAVPRARLNPEATDHVPPRAPAGRRGAAPNRTFWWLTLLAVAATYLLIVAGAVVRVTGSGDGCGPDWPTCQGRLLPPLETAALIEFTHRLLATLASTLILAVPVAAVLWRRERRIVVPALLMPLFLAVQIVLGAIVVWLNLPPMVVLVHLGFAMLILGGMAWLAVQAGPLPRIVAPGVTRAGHYGKLVLATVAMIYALILAGAYTRATGASWACQGFPSCLVPTEAVQALEAAGGPDLVAVHVTHRVIAYLTCVVAGAAVAETWRLRRGVPALLGAAAALAVTLLAQALVGVAMVTTGLPVALRGLHVAGAAAVWGSAVCLAALAWRVRTAPAAGPAGTSARMAPVERAISPAVKARAFLSLTKPKVILLLEVPTLAAMLVASPNWPPVATVLATLVGGALAAGGAAAINCYLDRDIDALMGQRTRQRAIPAGLVSPGQALSFGLALAVASFAVLSLFANLLAAFLAQVALLFYVFVYTRWLKRSTPSNIVIGGAAGAIPPLVGWAAVTGHVGPMAWLLFAIIFFWTPPHFWALSLLIKQHYERANVPMLPVVRGEAETRRQIICYTVQMIAVTTFLFAFRLSGLFYLGAALVLGGVFLYYAARLWREASAKAASRLFHYSMLYLWLLCVALVLDKRVFS